MLRLHQIMIFVLMLVLLLLLGMVLVLVLVLLMVREREQRWSHIVCWIMLLLLLFNRGGLSCCWCGRWLWCTWSSFIYSWHHTNLWKCDRMLVHQGRQSLAQCEDHGSVLFLVRS